MEEADCCWRVAVRMRETQSGKLGTVSYYSPANSSARNMGVSLPKVNGQ